jgi:hypothetical protein
MAAIISFLSFFGALIGLISVIYPLRFLYIRNRRTASAVLSIALVIFVFSAVVDGAERQRQQQQQQQREQQQALVTPPKSPNELAEESCNVSGAIPNCKEVMVKLIAEQAAHPKSPEPYESASAEPKPSREELERRRDAAYRQCWANANAAAARSGFKLTPEVVANPGLVNSSVRDMHLNLNELIEERTCEAAAKMENGGYSTFFHKSMYKGADGKFHDLD